MGGKLGLRSAAFSTWGGLSLWLVGLMLPTVRTYPRYTSVLRRVDPLVAVALVAIPAVAMLAGSRGFRATALALATPTLLGAALYAALRFYVIWFSYKDGSFVGPTDISLRSTFEEAGWVFMFLGALLMWKSARAVRRTGESHG